MIKLRILPLILLSIYMSSCSSSGQDDPVTPGPDNPDTPKPTPDLVSISFGGNSGAWQDAPNTRAGKSGLETLFPSFRVWGYKTTDADLSASQTVMNGYNVLYTSNSASASSSNSNDWEYVGVKNDELTSSQTIKYWDYSATSYRFFAYSPSDANITVKSSTGTNTDGTETSSSTTSLQSFSTPFAYNETATYKDFPYISELWFANSKDDTSKDDASKENYGKCVTLTFAPLIAKVRFKFTYPEGTTAIVIKDIKFQDSRYINQTATDGTSTTAKTPLKGTIKVDYPLTGAASTSTPTFSWTTSTEAEATGSLIFSIPYEDKDTPLHILEESQYGKWYFVPPLGLLTNADGQEQTQGSYTMTARINGNQSTATVPAEYMQWQPGFQYTYIFKITEAGTLITFSDLQVEQWQTAPNTDNNGSGTAGW